MCDEGIIPAEPECVKILQLDGDSLTCTVRRTFVLGAREEERVCMIFPDRVTLSVSKIQISNATDSQRSETAFLSYLFSYLNFQKKFGAPL